MENLIDTIYGILDIYREEYYRKRDYIKLCAEVKKLKKKIMNNYPTKARAIYETYMLFDELKRVFHNHIKVFNFREFYDLYFFENETYELINSVYGQ